MLYRPSVLYYNNAVVKNMAFKDTINIKSKEYGYEQKTGT